MRHLGSLIAGVVAVPLGWLLLAFGQVSSAKAFATAASTGAYHTHDFIRPLIFLAVAGIVIGLIASLRISPVGPVVAGVAFAGSYVALLIAPKRTIDTVSYTVTIAKQRAELAAPLTSGVTLVLGAALLLAVVSVGRWRRWPRPLAAEPADAVELTEPEGAVDDTLRTSPSWDAFASSTPAPTETVVSSPDVSSELPTRTPAAAWPASRSGPEETTESVPARGRSPWDTPLRGTGGGQ